MKLNLLFCFYKSSIFILNWSLKVPAFSNHIPLFLLSGRPSNFYFLTNESPLFLWINMCMQISRFLQSDRSSSFCSSLTNLTCLMWCFCVYQTCVLEYVCAHRSYESVHRCLQTVHIYIGLFFRSKTLMEPWKYF